VLVGPRIYHAMAVDGLFFPPLGRLHAGTNVPVAALVAQGGIAVAELYAPVISGSFEDLVSFTTFAMVAFSTLTVAAVVVLRRRRHEPATPGAFRVPGYPWVPLLFVAVNVWVLWSVLAYQGLRTPLVGLAIVATGVPAYGAFRAWGRSRETSR